MLMVQMANVFTQPLEQFLSTDMKESKKLFKNDARARGRYDQSVTKFYHIKKTDLDKIPEAEHELLQHRNDYKQSSLEYISTLNRLENSCKIQVVSRACAFLYSEKAFFSQGLSLITKLTFFLANFLFLFFLSWDFIFSIFFQFLEDF